jgi:hypothetical protein
MNNSVDFDIVGSFNNQRVAEIDSERSVNCFEYIDPLAKKKKSLVNTSGITDTGLVFPGAANGFRAEFVFDNIHYLVIGNAVYSVTTSNVVAFLGNIGTITGYVGVDANTFQVIFVDGEHGYIFDTNALTFTQITDDSFPVNPLDVCYLDGFFVVTVGGTNGFELSSFNQGLVWGPAANMFTTNFAVNNELTIGASTIGGLPGTDNYQTGVPVTLSTTSALPSPLVAGTVYYSIFIDATHIELATTYNNAILGIPIVLTSDGVGVQTITSEGQLQEGFMISHPGTIVACRTLHRRLFLFSQFFTEVWENAGIGTNLPFRRNNALLIEYGTINASNIAVGFDKLFFLSQDRDGLGSVMEVIGTQAIPVSNRALDFQLAQYAQNQQIADCRGFLIKENGLIFYRMNFTSANHTYVYDVTFSNPLSEETKYWHEEEVLNGDRHPAQTHAYFNGNNYVGDYLSPTLYLIDNAIYNNNGESIRRMRVTREFVPPGYQRLRVDRLQVDLLQGNVSDDTFTAQQYMYISISKDGGQTFGSRIKAPLGHVGQRSARTVWRKLGVTPRGQGFLAKFEYFEQTPFVILGASWCPSVLPE